MTSDASAIEKYQEQLRLLYRSLAVEGYTTFIHTAWDVFETISAGMLQITKPGIIEDYGCSLIYSMAIFETSRTFLRKPPYNNYFDEVLTPQEDEAGIKTDTIFTDILSNVSVVMFDNEEHDSFVQDILEQALLRGKRMININSPISPQ